MKAFNGHFGGGFVRSFTYIAMHGPDGLKDISQYAVLNANYLQARLRDTYKVPFDRICMHEAVLTAREELKFTHMFFVDGTCRTAKNSMQNTRCLQVAEIR